MSWVRTIKFSKLEKYGSSFKKWRMRSAHAPDVQAAPVNFDGPEGVLPHALKVDVTCQLGNLIVVAGWCTSATPLSLYCEGRNLGGSQLRTTRPDVAKHFKLASGKDLGFVFVAIRDGAKPVRLAWNNRDGAITVSQALHLIDTETMGQDHYHLIGETVYKMAGELPFGSTQWLDLIRRIPVTSVASRRAKGNVELTAAWEQNKDGVVVGWIACARNSGSDVWLEDEVGNTQSLDESYRWFRRDVQDFVGDGLDYDISKAGFMIRLKGLKPGSHIQMKTLSEDGVHILSEGECTVLSADPAATARSLFGITTPQSEFSQRVRLIDAPVLEPLIARRQKMLDGLSVQTKQVGTAIASPVVTVIVPLYGRADFVEHQLIEFVRDPWLLSNAELIYVIDDPRLVEGFQAEATVLSDLYKVPLSWVWGGANRGFSGANNLGAKYARGECLVFLNSDAFPQEPGWLQPLIDVLDTQPDVGAVAPRLVFADGSIQHAGMEFKHHQKLDIWINHHSHKGLDPVVDPNRELTIVPAVTGACLALRRTDFERVGGWDMGYLIGDFEDSDLCLKLRSQGLKVAYLPTTQLIHLERQSFGLMGQGEFRMRVTIYNALRHEQRWASFMHKSHENELDFN